MYGSLKGFISEEKSTSFVKELQTKSKKKETIE